MEQLNDGLSKLSLYNGWILFRTQETNKTIALVGTVIRSTWILNLGLDVLDPNFTCSGGVWHCGAMKIKLWDFDSSCRFHSLVILDSSRASSGRGFLLFLWCCNLCCLLLLGLSNLCLSPRFFLLHLALGLWLVLWKEKMGNGKVC